MTFQSKNFYNNVSVDLSGKSLILDKSVIDEIALKNETKLNKWKTVFYKSESLQFHSMSQSKIAVDGSGGPPVTASPPDLTITPEISPDYPMGSYRIAWNCYGRNSQKVSILTSADC